MVTNLPDGPYPVEVLRKPSNIDMYVSGEWIDYVRPSIVRVYDYNGVKGDNFQVYYLEPKAADGALIATVEGFSQWFKDHGVEVIDNGGWPVVQYVARRKLGHEVQHARHITDGMRWEVRAA